MINVYGPIQEEQNFFVTDSATEKLILCSRRIEDSENRHLFFANPADPDNSDLDIVIMSATWTDDKKGVKFKDVGVKRELARVSTYTREVQLMEHGTVFTIDDENDYTPWYEPVIMLTTNYQLLLDEHQEAQIRASSDETSNRLVNFRFKPLPTHQYLNCNNSTREYQEFDDNSLGAVLEYFCGKNGKSTPGCESYEVKATQGFSRLEDCMWGKITFCHNPDLCGTEDCLGPCKDKHHTCNSDKNVKCSIDPASYFEGQWWKSKWFIGAMITLVVLAIIGGIVVLLLIRHAETTSSNDDIYDDIPQAVPTKKV